MHTYFPDLNWTTPLQESPREDLQNLNQDDFSLPPSQRQSPDSSSFLDLSTRQSSFLANIAASPPAPSSPPRHNLNHHHLLPLAFPRDEGQTGHRHSCFHQMHIITFIHLVTDLLMYEYTYIFYYIFLFVHMRNFYCKWKVYKLSGVPLIIFFIIVHDTR